MKFRLWADIFYDFFTAAAGLKSSRNWNLGPAFIAPEL